MAEKRLGEPASTVDAGFRMRQHGAPPLRANCLAMHNEIGANLSCFCLAVPKPPEEVCGTGFYLRWRGQIWIATTAHIMTKSNCFQDPATWPQVLYIKKPEFRLEVRIAKEVDSGRPVRTLKGNEGRMFDMLLIPQPADRVLQGHRIYDLGQELANEPSNGAAVYHHGFPLSDHDISADPRIRGNQIVGSEDYYIHLAGPIEEGLSGGPVVSDAGGLLGLSVGHNDGRGLVIRTTALAAALV